jgi:methionyl-tRNA formyltransferase
MRLVFFGSGAFGLPTLERLLEENEVKLVVSQPDRPAGRNRALTATPIAKFAQSRSMNVMKPPSVNEGAMVDSIRAFDVDAFIVIAFGQKLGKALLQDRFAINLHGSLLPKYRGAAPINWAMINGETEAGLSVITLAERMDAGDVLGQCATAIDPRETAGELHDRLAMLGPALMLEVLRQHESHSLEPLQQDETKATHAPKLSKADGRVSFDQPAQRVRLQIHGKTPWPGCFFKNGERLFRIHRAQMREQHSEIAEPGTVLSDYSVACSPGTIEILEVQPAGGKIMSFRAYRNGQPIEAGSRLEPQ